jgi:hypothetical protein
VPVPKVHFGKMASDTDGRDNPPSNKYSSDLNGIKEDVTIPQTPDGSASFADFGTPEESHDEIPRTDGSGTAPTTPTNQSLAKVLFDTPSGGTTEGSDKIAGPTETLATPPRSQSQPLPAPSKEDKIMKRTTSHLDLQ